MKFREVERNIEKEVIKKKEDENFKKIKPETNITTKEAIDFLLNNVFASSRES